MTRSHDQKTQDERTTSQRREETSAMGVDHLTTSYEIADNTEYVY